MSPMSMSSVEMSPRDHTIRSHSTHPNVNCTIPTFIDISFCFYYLRHFTYIDDDSRSYLIDRMLFCLLSLKRSELNDNFDSNGWEKLCSFLSIIFFFPSPSIRQVFWCVSVVLGRIAQHQWRRPHSHSSRQRKRKRPRRKMIKIFPYTFFVFFLHFFFFSLFSADSGNTRYNSRVYDCRLWCEGREWKWGKQERKTES